MSAFLEEYIVTFRMSAYYPAHIKRFGIFQGFWNIFLNLHLMIMFELTSNIYKIFATLVLFLDGKLIEMLNCFLCLRPGGSIV